MALVAVLLVIAGLSVIVIAFVLTMKNQRASTLSYSQSFKADQLAQGGAWWIVKELQEEMATETPVDTTGGYPIYRYLYAAPPSLNMGWVPQPVGTNADIVSLLKISLNGTSSYSGTSPYLNANGGVLPSDVRTDAPSLNGRKVDAARWSEACFGNFAPAELPYWIMVTRSGPASVINDTVQLHAFSNVQDTNNYVIGRYAYAIYDEGGLIDINLAGYPQTYRDNSTNATADLARKGSPGMMDLTAIPWFSTNLPALTNFIDNWRNPSSATNMQTYTNYLYSGALTSTNGQAGTVLQATNTFGTMNNYLYVAPGDNLFLSRQDLIAFTQWYGSGMTNILPYVTTFSRDVNAPSFDPEGSPVLASGSIPSAGGYSGGITEQPSGYSGGTNYFNPYIPLVRQANGRPLVSQRFPLSRLSLFTNGAMNADAISNYFGLTNNVDNYSWTYYRSPTAIATLAQVATNSPARSPDFFESLQASVLQGSLPPLVQTSGPITNWSSYAGGSSPYPPIPWVSAIVMAMGVNIIDQSTSDNWPTIVKFNNEQYTGDKSVPYLSEFLQWTYRPSSNQSNIMLVCPVEFWNPYQNATNNPTSISGPTNFRTIIEPYDATNKAFGNVYWDLQGLNVTKTATNFPPGSVTNGWQPINWYYTNSTPDANKPSVTFTNSAIFSEPNMVTNIVGSPGRYWTNYVEGAKSISGFFAGLATNVPDARMYTNTVYPTSNWVYQYSGLITMNSGNVSLQMQFQDTNGNWHPYQGYSGSSALTTQITPVGFTAVTNSFPMVYVDNSTATNFDAGITRATLCFTNFNYMVQSAGFADPRSYLGGLQFEAASPNFSVRPLNTTAGVKKGRSGYYPVGYAFPYYVSTLNTNYPYSPYEGMLDENWPENDLSIANGWSNPTNTYLYDMDGNIRPGDGYLGLAANPYLANNPTSFAARPILLNRPFRSVGEMGFTFRGQAPWKSINFFSTNSGDAGLLDMFGNDPAPLVAGKINLNTRQPVTLQAALQGAYKTEQINSQSLTTNSIMEASNFAQAIVAQTANNPFVNRADLVRQFASSSAYANDFTTPADAVVKSHRESILRPLAELGTTRTWNLMIDVVAQVGHYPANASTLYPGDLSKFIVEGERRYWLHVAIDRVTGQVVDYKLELYSE